MARTHPVYVDDRGRRYTADSGGAGGYAGFLVGHVEAEEDRWTALVRSNPEPSRSFIGGDATSALFVPDLGESFWTHADTLVGTVDGAGFITSTSLVKNSAVRRAANGTLLQQVFGGPAPAAEPAWRHPNHPARGFTVMDQVLDGSGTALADGVAVGWAEPQTFDGSVNDGVVMTINAFGGVGTFTGLDTGGGVFLPTAVHNHGGFHYVLGRETDLDAMFPEGLINGKPWCQACQTNYTRVARAPLGALPTPAAWQFWTGAGWASGVTSALGEAARLRDTAGRVVDGITDLTHTGTEFVLVAVPQTVESRFDLYRAPQPQGPWLRYASGQAVPRSPDVGADPPAGLDYWYGFPKFQEFLDAPGSRFFTVSHSQGNYPLIIGNVAPPPGQHASQGTPNVVLLPRP